ncbi:hypothetical protein [Arthrobacter sp. JSM 101049]|uniref:hypothetical protein n=1 Tax=Arthrobacter sp. JSM 101049 TaxID=929097 RepID=UPI003561946F
MLIGRANILEYLTSHGGGEKVEQAQRDLPEQVDTERDSAILQDLGLAEQDIAALDEGGYGG